MVRDIDVGASRDCLGKYIRVRVVVDIDKPLQRFFRVNMSNLNKEVVMLLCYKRLPKYCLGCGLIGHSVNECLHEDETSNASTEDKYKFGSWLHASSLVKSVKSQTRRDNLIINFKPMRSLNNLSGYRAINVCNDDVSKKSHCMVLQQVSAPIQVSRTSEVQGVSVLGGGSRAFRVAIDKNNRALLEDYSAGGESLLKVLDRGSRTY
ncbi:hypothetical protein ACOSQ4_007051 [Xanthoceras sorbifolium]